MRLGLAALAMVAACAQSGGTMVGIVIAVEGDLSAVTSFTILVEDDTFVFIPVEGGEYAFPLPHLREHLRDGTPVRVGWEQRGADLAAVSLEDG
ncbi:MAG TPA: hypothetical protein VFY46_06625 [Acidimicrobiia bacterium]|nr:hypothetical protein [Acidimicrobiia bacterium]